MPVILAASAGQAEVPNLSSTPTNTVKFLCRGLQTFSVLRGFIYAACLEPCIAYRSVQGYA